MLILLFVIHVLIAIALVGVVLLQKSEGGALGMGGGGMSGFMTGRSTANLLTRTTAVLAVMFFLTSILLVKFSTYSGAPASILDLGPGSAAPMLPARTGPKLPAGGALPGKPASTTPAGPAPPLAK
jgi:preprotein translocase subunit SecG